MKRRKKIKLQYKKERVVFSDILPYELPIIFLTARSQTQDLVMGFEVGANDYLTKPITKEELLARVDMHLQLYSATQYLDRKVAERTEELRAKNEGLKQAQQQINDQRHQHNVEQIARIAEIAEVGQ